MKRYLAIKILFWLLITANSFAQVALNPDPVGVVPIPDPNLREAIRETLQLPVGSPITQQDMEKLHHLDAYDMGIADLTGLEYANNLESLNAWDNPILDLTPLANLTELRVLDLAGCQIVGLTPLQNLTQLVFLHLTGNPITDLTPLSNLTQLEELKIRGNITLDYSPIEGLAIPRLIRDEPCVLPALPIKERLQNRSFPSVFAEWGDVHNSRVNNLTHFSHAERLALHDFNWDIPYLNLELLNTDQGWHLKGVLEDAYQIRENLFSLNPNMLLLVEVRMRDAWIGYYPEDFPYWLKTQNGNIVKDEYDFVLIDFTQPAMQEIIVQQSIAVAQCGLFDGIFFDWWKEDIAVLGGPGTGDEGYRGFDTEQRARDNIIGRIRSQVPDDFLIIGNTNREKIPRTAWAINGSFMETGRDTHHELPVINGHPYGYEGLKRIEDTLLWLEQNLREPQINCLEGWGIPSEPPDSPTNLRFMRVITTMSLTHSDGYVLYSTQHGHIWYDFWNADLGRPIGPKAHRYRDIDGLFIREFTNGWAVYNRSGNAQTISLPQFVTGFSSGKRNITHLLPDLDGEIYLRVGKPFDLNRDGTVNILDLILVSQYFGTAAGDINGDGTTDILDLTLVAQQFSQ